VVVFSRDELTQYEMQHVFDAHARTSLGICVMPHARGHARYRLWGVRGCTQAVANSRIHPNDCIRTDVKGAQNIINATIENGVQEVITLRSVIR
jgi:UDP-N-acetylglucosamine 4,6-dehydratase